VAQAGALSLDRPVPTVTSVGKARLQEQALRRIRRLAGSGLALHPFVHTLFDLMADAIPAGDIPRAMETDPSNPSWVFGNLDQAKWVPILAEATAGQDPSAWAGFRPRDQLERAGKALFTFEEFTLPDYRRSAVYHDCLHPLKCEQGVLLQLINGGQLMGYYPLYRSSAMKPFDRDDRCFLSAAAPYIAHGLKAAKLVTAVSHCPDKGAAPDAPGVVVMNHDGHVLGIDKRARTIFLQVGMYEGVRWSAFAEPSALLEYVAMRLRKIFNGREQSPSEIGPPAVAIFSHRAGIVLKLTGHQAPGERGEELFVVLVEQLEPEAFLRARLMYRYGLTPREGELLMLLRSGQSVAQTGKELGISLPTAKTYARNLIDKLEVTGLRALRTIP
jgi:DNA-binding CsgD family transcriptional regulator